MKIKAENPTLVERLRDSKRENRIKAYVSGLAAGKKWVRNCTDYPALQRLAEVYRLGWGWREVLGYVGDPFMNVLDLVNGPNEDGYAANDLAEDYDLQEFGSERAFAEGFLQGAWKVFAEVRGQL